MLDSETRGAILRLHEKGHGIRAIARALKISRNSVKTVLRQGSSQVPELNRPSAAEPQRELIGQLYLSCAGNVVRVQEELQAMGITISYSTLTGFCRREGISLKPKKRTGHYHFDPGEEMQHDTSPHDVLIGDKKQRLQCASCVLCYSRKLYAQVYPTFNRFYCKSFLTEAVRYFGGAASRCMVDNTSVVIAAGTGKNAVTAPELVALGQRFGFVFAAHEKGDANRSARVEGPFNFIEKNFYPGRKFVDLADVNRQLITWCDSKAHRFLRELQSRPVDLFQTERLSLKPLPLYIPQVYDLHSRIVNLEGYIQLHTNRYSVPDQYLGRRVQVRETLETVSVYDGHRLLAEHPRQPEGACARMICKQHRTKGGRPPHEGTPVLEEEKTLRVAAPELNTMVTLLREGGVNRPLRQIRKLHRFYIDYPTDALCQAVSRALQYGLTDLDRIEQMTLRLVAGEYFRLNINDNLQDDDDDDNQKQR
jgi:transposase